MSRWRSGMFAVVSVCRPGPKESSALPSRKNSAHWFSLTMSWGPSFSSPPPAKRQTISRPESSFHSMTSIAMAVLPQASEIRGLLQDLVATPHLQLKRRGPFVDLAPVSRRAPEPVGEGDDVGDERRVVGVDGRELRLADLELVEHAAVTVVGVPQPRDRLLE